MGSSGPPATDDPYLSASDLAEFAYCPRALHYRRNPPPGPEDPTTLRRRDSGALYHSRSARGMGRRERTARYWAVVLGVAVVTLAVLVGGAVSGWF